MPADRVTLTELRKLAREAGLTLAKEEQGYRMRWHYAAYSELMTIETRNGSKMAARRQLRDLLERIIAGSSSDEYDRGYRDGKDGRWD
jgi:hypothetical protein